VREYLCLTIPEEISSMLDLKLVRETPDAVRAGLMAKKADPTAVDRLLELDEKRRQLIQETDELKKRRNDISRQIPIKAKAGENIEELKAESREIGGKLEGLDNALKEVEEQQRDLLIRLPNMPHASTPVGTSEEDNVVVRTWGEARR